MTDFVSGLTVGDDPENTITYPIRLCKHARQECEECRIIVYECAGTSAATAGRRIEPCGWGLEITAALRETNQVVKEGRCTCNGFIRVAEVKEYWKNTSGK